MNERRRHTQCTLPRAMPDEKKTEMQALASQLRDWAGEAGFNQLAISDTDTSGHADHLARWLDSGFHGSMEYMARHQALRNAVSATSSSASPGSRVVSRCIHMPGAISIRTMGWPGCFAARRCASYATPATGSNMGILMLSAKKCGWRVG